MGKLVVSALLTFVVAISAGGATRTWTGASGDRWSDANNWNGGVPQPGDDLAFTLHEPSYARNDLPAGTTVRSILASAGPWAFSGNAVALTHGMSAQTATIAFPIAVAGTQQWTALCCHIITLAAPVDLQGSTLTLRTNVLDGDSGFDLDAPMTGGGTVVLAAQRVILGADGVWSSETALVLAAGTLDVNDRAASVRSFAMNTAATFVAGARPLAVSERVQLAGELRFRGGAGEWMILRNDGSAPVEGRFDRVPANATVLYDGGDGNDVVVRIADDSRVATATSLASAKNPAAANEPVVLTATVVSSSGPPVGTVTLRVDGNALATVPLDASGRATYTVAMSAGVQFIDASYDGSTTHAPSASATLVQIAGELRRRAIRHGGS